MSEAIPDKGNILIVDDMPASLEVLIKILTEQGYEVRPAQNGQIALTAIQELPPDLVLLDICLPDMDGYEICQRLKADDDAQIRNIPIIFISVHGETEDKVKAFKIGGVDYITKPFQVEEVLARVNTHLTIRNLQRQLEEKNRQLQNQNEKLEKKKTELQEALDNIKTLRGLIPICASCKKIRDDDGFWQQVEAYISEHSQAQFSHSLCPECAKKLYPEICQEIDQESKED